MYDRAFGTTVNSVAGTVTPADPASIVARVGTIGDGQSVTFGAMNAEFRLTGFIAAPPFVDDRVNAAPIVYVVATLPSTGNSLDVTAYDSRGTRISGRGFISAGGSGSAKTYGFPLLPNAASIDPAITIRVRASQWVSNFTVDAVYLDYYSASGVISVPGVFGPTNSWVASTYYTSWQSSKWAQAGSNFSDRCFIKFPPITTFNPQAELVGSSFTINQAFWSNVGSSGVSQSPSVTASRQPLVSPPPFDSTPSSKVTPSSFSASQGYFSDSVNSSPANNYVYFSPDPMEYGFVGWSWADGSQSAGGCVPTLQDFIDGQIAMGYSTQHQWTVQTPYVTDARTEIKLPVLNVYYDNPPNVGMFMEA